MLYLGRWRVLQDPAVDDAKQCILVIIGVTEQGRKEFVAIEDGYRESEQSWSELLADQRARAQSCPEAGCRRWCPGILASVEQGLSANGSSAVLGA